VERANSHTPQRNRNKLNPSGVAPYMAKTMPGLFGGEDCLIPIREEIVTSMMAPLGGAELLRFVSVGYEAKANAIFQSLGLKKDDFELHRVWDTFSTMLPYMPAAELDEVEYARARDYTS
jgi:hypothetical protein